MFGNHPGVERRQGVLNQHIVTRLDSVRRIYWVMHTRGEDPVSILIAALQALVNAKKLKNEELLNLVSAIGTRQSFEERDAFDRVKREKVQGWTTMTFTFLETLLNAATQSCVLGVVNMKVDDE
jgi:hypothetical protein